MSVINSQPLIGASGNQSTAYNLTRSLRFRSSASAYLNRTPSTTSGTQKYTISVWFKRGNFGAYVNLIGASCPNPPFGNTFDGFRFNNSDQLEFAARGGNDIYVVPSMVFRDPAAWYHVVVAVDTTQATASNRVKFYVNGVLQTAFASATYPSQNYNMLGWNVSGNAHSIGSDPASLGTSVCDSYMAEINVISGSQELHTAFGETDTATGVWKPKKYTGTYGTNGFYLKFDNLTSTSTLGNDSSGNSNTWTVNNISLTSGSTYDSMKDVPTLTDADTANYCTLNPLDNTSQNIRNGNLQCYGAAAWGHRRSTFMMTSGKWYWEVTPSFSGGSYILTGVVTPSASLSQYVGQNANGWGFDTSNGGVVNNGSTTSYGSAVASGVVIGVAFDADTGKLWFRNASGWFNSGDPATATNPAVTIGSGSFFAAGAGYDSTDINNFNFGQQGFSYTPPTGFKALNTFNLPTPTIGATASTQANKYMNVVTYTGTGSSQSITGVGFQPDWTWIKGRSGATDHGLYDAVRGVQKQIESNNADAETTETTGLTAFGSDGFTVGALAQLNTSSATYVGWNWKANGAGSSNTAGTITSTVSANTTAGFSIVTYTGTGSNATVGHGLGVAPKLLFVKSRTGVYNWRVWHTSLAGTDFLYLNATDATATNTAMWNSTTPTSSVFSLGTNAGVNGSGDTFVAYCFAEVAGYSAFGSYTGNGSTDGTFVYTGFRPKWIMVKNSSAGGKWVLMDTNRGLYNEMTGSNALYPNTSDAEGTDSANRQMDFLSNGFKLRCTGGDANGSGNTIIYAAFAENPFKYSLAR